MMEGDMIQGISNALSTLTIASCLFLKVPQILQIREKKSADGIYVQALLMEILSFSITTLYNFSNGYSIMTYLEYPIILLEVYIMLFYVLKYKGMLGLPIVLVGLLSYYVIVSLFILGLLPVIILSILLPFCTPISGFAKVTYIYGIIRMGNADGVSLVTWMISIATNATRIFTVYVDSADFKLLINFIVSLILSSAVMFTALYYQRKTQNAEQTTSRRQSTSRKRLAHND